MSTSKYQKSNDFNNNLLDSMNQEVQVGHCQSYANKVHNEGMLILDRNVDASTGAPIEEDVQPPIQLNEDSKIVESKSSSIPYEYSVDIQKFDHMQRKFEMGQAISIHDEFLIPDHVFMDNTLHPMFAWFLMLEKILKLEF